MKELLIATKNPGKFKEISEVLEGSGYVLKFLGDFEVEDSDFEEDGDSYQENALKKARYYFDKLGLLTLGEDSGIRVEALSGELGVKTRRWGAGEKASDDEWIEFFMKRMKEEVERGASFVCNVCVYDGSEPVFFEAETKGRIADQLLAPIMPGLPLSSCFIPEGHEKAYAQLTVEEKNSVSHRGRAMGEARKFLADLFSGF